MPKLLSAILAMSAFGLAGCIVRPPPAPWSPGDPANPNATDASSAPERQTLISSTRLYIDPSVGREAREMMHDHAGMDHGTLSTGGMKGMDHSKTPTAEPNGSMEGMDHSKMNHGPSTGTAQKPAAAAPAGKSEPDHSKHELKPETAAQPKAPASTQAPSAEKDVLAAEMKKTSEEMQKTIDALKAKADALRAKNANPKTTPGKAPPPPGSDSHPH
jgi:hypothetical protein